MRILRMILNREGDSLVDVEANCIPDFLERDGDLILYRLNGKVEDLGHFPVFESIFLDQFEDDLALWGELVDGFFDKGEHVGGDQQLFGVEVNAGEFGMEFFEGIGAVTFLVAEIVEGGVADGDVEVDFKVFDLFQIAPFLPDANEHIGNDLLCGFPGFEHGFGEEEQRRVKEGEHLLISLLIIKAGNP